MPVFLLLLLRLLSAGPAAAPRATVYVFLADTCPISPAATLPLRELRAQYAGSHLMADISYDNTARNRRNPYSPPQQMQWGESTLAEMLLALNTVLSSQTPVT